MCENRLKVKGIFLDFDGTIVDSKEAYIEAAKIAFQAVGQRAPENKVALEIPKRLEQGLTKSETCLNNHASCPNANRHKRTGVFWHIKIFYPCRNFPRHLSKAIS